MRWTPEQLEEHQRRVANQTGSVSAPFAQHFAPSAKAEKRRATRRKYGNVPTVVDGQQFDSKREAERYQELKLMEKAGAIRNLRTQVRWPIVVNDVEICLYVSDFDYEKKVDPEGAGYAWYWQKVTEDVKSKATMTDVFRLKRKLMKAVHGIDIEIVE